MVSREKIAIFAYSWSNAPYVKLDIYLNEFVTTFSSLGFDVDVYVANQYVECDGILGFSGNVNLHKINEKIQNKKYKFILSINNALLTRSLDSLRLQPVIGLIVDDFNHLFNHDKTGLYDQFSYADIILFSSYSHIKKLESNNLSVADRLRFYPTATTVPVSSKNCDFLPKVHNITWVASLLDASGYTLLYKHCTHKPDRAALLNGVVDVVREGGQINYDHAIGDESISGLLKEHKWSRQFFEMQIQNLISNQSRISVVDSLHELGLSVFGNHEWINAAAYNSNILTVYNDGSLISSHEDIMKIYNKSKICINMSQLQSGAALPYRVMDILASDALLITNYHPQSDAFTIFGKDCPIVMYKSMEELSTLCEYYLAHEDERRGLVVKCNDMVRHGFDFRNRCEDILDLCGLPSEREELSPGNIYYVNSDEFVFWSSKIKVRLRGIVKKLIKSFFSLLPIALRRSLIINLRA